VTHRNHTRWGGAYRVRVLLKAALVAVLVLWTATADARGRRGSRDGNFPWSDVPVTIHVQGVGVIELPALILDEKEELYLPVLDLFEFLKIRCTASDDFDTVQGSFLPAIPSYTIDYNNGVIWIGRQPIYLKSGDAVRLEDGLYLRAPLFEKVFGLRADFNFRSLTVNLTSRTELPVIRETRLAEGRTQLAAGPSALRVDTAIQPTFRAFSFGAADWMMTVVQRPKEALDVRGTLAMGFTTLGGETMVSLNWGKYDGMAPNRQFYLWRWVDNSNKLVRQVQLGKIFTPVTSSIFAPVVGVQVTNTPTRPRQAFSTYRLAAHTQPFWTVELYVNGALVEYKKADSAGFYVFDVPLTYGVSDVRLRFYGLHGEEQVRDEIITVPFAFLPKGELEYSVNAGVLADSTRARFGRAGAAYGITSAITAGGGVEYLSRVESGPVMPYLNASARLGTRLLVGGEWGYSVRTRTSLTYRSARNLLLEITNTQYTPGQTAILTNYRFERRAMLTVPLRMNRVSLFSRFSYNLLGLPGTTMRTGEWMMTGNVAGALLNMTTFTSLAPESRPVLYTNMAVAFRCPRGVLLTPQVQYDYVRGGLMSAKCLVEKLVFQRGFITASYEQNFVNNLRIFGFGLRYDFRFGQVGHTALVGREGHGFVTMARGGLTYDPQSRHLNATHRTTVGRAGIVVVPFLDFNANGKQDADEPRAAGFRFRGTGGRIEEDARDTVIRIYDLEPYTQYILHPDASGFENIAWTIKPKAISAAVVPNQMTRVDVPVQVQCEISGTVYTSDERGRRRGRSRIVVFLQNESGQTIARTLSEQDGYYSFQGLAPGVYRAVVEEEQMRKLGMTATPEKQEVRLLRKTEGDAVGGVNFCLRAVADKKAECP